VPQPRPVRFRSCGAVVVRQTPMGYRLLMLRAFRHWDFPKGLMEEGEDHLTTAIREVREESTIADLSFPWGDVWLESGPYSQRKVARYYLALTRQESVAIPPSPDNGRPEHSEYRWVSFDEARNLAAPRVRAVIDWAEPLVMAGKPTVIGREIA
jgi:8-oxo-dGTP pyrophosphatase MutT (NUDIX family)